MTTPMPAPTPAPAPPPPPAPVPSIRDYARAKWATTPKAVRRVIIGGTAAVLAIIIAMATGLFSKVPGAHDFGEWVLVDQTKQMTVDEIRCDGTVSYSVAPTDYYTSAIDGVFHIIPPRGETLTVNMEEDADWDGTYRPSYVATNLETYTFDIALVHVRAWGSTGTFQITWHGFHSEPVTWAGACSR
ncbi:hypothetical protein [Actinomyces glycerinitolerans]|uniref:Uncharacterized protein n=1 Tax=Actinomyces glycerinitolerans TaxID=1892869 RepID=A0A1M4RZQ4_9ACTO|nr:hypothetical protein [Actinomyces glycerinitolerans]SHE25207.1 Hypothetical protein ACGLYG10_1423 [Actinomyces glycerinitolerans]